MENPPLLQPQQQGCEESTKQPRLCRLLALPAELRIRIYEAILFPTGVLTLSRTKFKRFAVTPAIKAASFLSTCRQISREAGDILYQNEVCFVVDAHDTSWPTISESRLPQTVLERLQHLCVLLDCSGPFRASYEDVHFDAFTALISLRSMKIGVLCYFDNNASPVDTQRELPISWFEVLGEVLMRLPTGTVLNFHFEDGSQQQEMVSEQLNISCRKLSKAFIPIQMPAFDVQLAMNLVPAELRGSLSGSIKDVFEAFRL